GLAIPTSAVFEAYPYLVDDQRRYHASQPEWLKAMQRLVVEGIEFVRMAGGEFWMGAPPSDTRAYFWERPEHRVQMSPFWIAKYPTTIAQFDRFVRQMHRPHRREWEPNGWNGDHPVICEQREAELYCGWLTVQASKSVPALAPPGVQLASEAEW